MEAATATPAPNSTTGGPSREWVGRILILLLAAVLRLALLDIRPPHFDEGVNGYIADQISREHLYRYHPEVGHGPLTFYLVRAGEELLGHNLWGLRISAVTFSLLAVWLCFRFDTLMGRRPADLAALLMALSPSMTFVGRTAIGESAFAFFLLLMLWGAARLTVQPAFSARLAVVFGGAGALAVKEVAPLHYGALLVAVGGVVSWKRRGVNAGTPCGRAVLQYVALLVAALSLLWLLYSAGGRFPEAAGRLWQGIEKWRHIGSGEHQKPWHYWLGLLLWDEPVLFLGVFLLPWMLWKGSAPTRFLACYSLGILIGYSAISYKTPWCLASLGVSLPLAVAAAVRTASPVLRCLGGGLAVLLLPFSLAHSLHLNLWAHSAPRESLVYVATSPELGVLLRVLERHAAGTPRGAEVRAKVFATEPHPLPWLLRNFPRVEYLQTALPPSDYDSGFVVVEPSRLIEVERHLQAENYERHPMRWRVDQPPGAVFFHRHVFRERKAE